VGTSVTCVGPWVCEEGRVCQHFKPKFKSNKILRNTANVFGKWHENMWGKDYLNALDTARKRMDSIEVDRTKVKPMVKITGEF
jgi:predicted nucleotide-binding protein (sugar kinase/HSP70/actin superfamily)